MEGKGRKVVIAFQESRENFVKMFSIPGGVTAIYVRMLSILYICIHGFLLQFTVRLSLGGVLVNLNKTGFCSMRAGARFDQLRLKYL